MEIGKFATQRLKKTKFFGFTERELYFVSEIITAHNMFGNKSEEEIIQKIGYGCYGSSSIRVQQMSVGGI